MHQPNFHATGEKQRSPTDLSVRRDCAIVRSNQVCTSLFLLLPLGPYHVYKRTNFAIPVYSGSIEICDFTLGNRTPYFKYVTAYDNEDDNRKIKATEVNFNHPRDDLMTRGKYQAVIHLDAGLTSPEARFVIRIRLGNKGYGL